MWKLFARLVLEAAYEATFCVAIINASERAIKSLSYIACGGAFGNDPQWIADAIERSCRLFGNANLDAKVVCYRAISPVASRLLRSFSGYRQQITWPLSTYPYEATYGCEMSL